MAGIDAIERARQRRVESAGERTARIQWFLDECSDKITLTMRARLKLAGEYLKNKIIRNISVPVVKEVLTRYAKDPESGKTKRRQSTRVTQRSKPGEYPRADTTQLMKTIFCSPVMEESPGVLVVYVGTPLDYGAILELEGRLDRSYLLRTFYEERPVIAQILSGPIK